MPNPLFELMIIKLLCSCYFFAGFIKLLKSLVKSGNWRHLVFFSSWLSPTCEVVMIQQKYQRYNDPGGNIRDIS